MTETLQSHSKAKVARLLQALTQGREIVSIEAIDTAKRRVGKK
jgi:hypothetical protein